MLQDIGLMDVLQYFLHSSESSYLLVSECVEGKLTIGYLLNDLTKFGDGGMHLLSCIIT